MPIISVFLRMKSVDNTQKEGAVHVLACLAVLFLG